MENKKGFTLVGLSIVLVIIGLLIGGILAAQIMVETAKITSQINQIQQLDVAVNNFKTKYNSLPGDSDKFANPGDNNGLIDPHPLSPGNARAAFRGEVIYFFPHIQLGLGMFSNYTFYTTFDCNPCSSSPPNLNLLPAKIGNGGIMVAYDNSVYNTGFNAYSFTISYSLIESADRNFSPVSADPARFHPYVECKKILSMDAKLDDGIETTGNVRGGFSAANNCSNYTALDQKGLMLVKMLAQAGG